MKLVDCGSRSRLSIDVARESFAKRRYKHVVVTIRGKVTHPKRLETPDPLLTIYYGSLQSRFSRSVAHRSDAFPHRQFFFSFYTVSTAETAVINDIRRAVSAK